MKKIREFADCHIFVFSILFGFMLWLSSHIYIYNYDPDLDLREVQAAFISCNYLDVFKLSYFVVISYFFILLLYRVIVKTRTSEMKSRSSGRWIFIICFITDIIIWIPCLLTYYPGCIYYDTRISLIMARGIERITNHHPVLYTLSWRAILKLGSVLSLNDNTTLFIYTLLQCIGMACSIAYFIYICYIKGYNKWFITGVFLFYSLFNMIPMNIISLWKDTPFSIAAFLFSAYIFNHISDKNVEINGKRDVISYLLLSVFFVFTRNNAMYVYIVFTCIITTFFLYRLLKTRMLKTEWVVIISVFVSVTTVIIRGPVFEQLHLNYSNKAECSGVMLQQIANVIVGGGEVTPNDLEFLDGLIDVDTLNDRYHPFSVDDIKWNEGFNYFLFNRDFGRFTSVYLRTMIHNPVQAFYSFVLSTEGFWDITRQMNRRGYVCDYMKPSTDNEYKIDIIDKTSGKSLESFYNPRYLYSSALFAWIILFCFLVGLKEKKSTIIALLPSLGIWFTLLIATPVAFMMRYAFCLVLTMPIGIAILFQPQDNDRKTNDSL